MMYVRMCDFFFPVSNHNSLYFSRHSQTTNQQPRYDTIAMNTNHPHSNDDEYDIVSSSSTRMLRERAELEARVEKLEQMIADMKLCAKEEDVSFPTATASFAYNSNLSPTVTATTVNATVNSNTTANTEANTGNISNGNSNAMNKAMDNSGFVPARTLISTMEEYHLSQQQLHQKTQQENNNSTMGFEGTQSIQNEEKIRHHHGNYYDALALQDPISEDDELMSTKTQRRKVGNNNNTRLHKISHGKVSSVRSARSSQKANENRHRNSKSTNDTNTASGGRPPMYIPASSSYSNEIAYFSSVANSNVNRSTLSSADDGAGIPMPLGSTSSSGQNHLHNTHNSAFNRSSTPVNLTTTMTPIQSSSSFSSINATRRPRSPSDVSVASATSGIGRVMASPALKPVSTVLDYVKDGMTNRHQEGKAEYDSDVAIQEFLRVPFRVEVLLMFGLLVCVDCFLYVLTFLPLKFIWSTFCLLRTIIDHRKNSHGVRFQRRHFYHVVQIAVIVIVSYMLNQVSIGRLYHWIRVQAMIKLYVIVAMVDVFDRLLISFGKDATDSLYWNINRRPCHPRCIASILVVLCYAAIHALLLFVHAATVNVALNSADAALLSLLVSGNFAEIKSTVFKKYQKKNLFDITTSDINERFKLFLFLFLIFVLNICQGTNEEMTSDFVYVGVIVFCSEIIADWIKHCFITKLNFIKSDVYIEYRRNICTDITGKGAPEGINMDHTHNVVRRVGLAQIPLACVLVRYLSEAAKYSTSLLEISNPDLILLVLLIFMILFIVKIFIGIVVLNLATWNLSDVPDDNKVADEFSQRSSMKPYTKPLRSISMQQLFHGSLDKIHID